MRTTLTVAAVGFAALICTTTASATTFSATVTPAQSGTEAAPVPVTVNFDITAIAAGANGNPTTGTDTINEVTPTTFASDFAAFGTCPTATVSGSGTTQPACPADSVLGSVSSTLFAPALGAAATTDKGIIYKTGTATFMVWLHVSNPASIAATVPGSLIPASSSAGPVASWNLSPAAHAQNYAHLAIYPSTWDTTWTLQSSTASTTSTPQSAEAARLAKAKRARTTCLKRASRLKKKQRSRAITACNRAYARAVKQAKTTKVAHNTQLPHASTTSASPFVTIGCQSSVWSMQAELVFVNGNQQTLTSNVNCATGAGSSGSGSSTSLLGTLLGLLPLPS